MECAQACHAVRAGHLPLPAGWHRLPQAGNHPPAPAPRADAPCAQFDRSLPLPPTPGAPQAELCEVFSWCADTAGCSAEGALCGAGGTVPFGACTLSYYLGAKLADGKIVDFINGTAMTGVAGAALRCLPCCRVLRGWHWTALVAPC